MPQWKLANRTGFIFFDVIRKKEKMSNLLVYRTLLIKFAFSSLLIFMHFLYALYSWLIDQTIFKQPDPWQNRSVNGYKKYQLKKLPNHLVVSVCQEEVFYEYLAKLLAWALFLEVPVISFYHNENGNILKFYILSYIFMSDIIMLMMLPDL